MASTTESLPQGVIPLRGVVQNYAWGKTGATSSVARLARVPIEATTPYAELWLGTHVSGPATVTPHDSSSSQPLADYLATSIEGYKDGLPYLLKVLSIRQALSIQAHPDAQLASTLHQKFPTIYRDPNHKPELAIAVTPMHVMCSFRPVNEISDFLCHIPELRQLIGEDLATSFVDAARTFSSPSTPTTLPEDLKSKLEGAYGALLKASDDTVKLALKSLLERVDEKAPAVASIALADWDFLVQVIRTISKDYEGDVGVMSVFFLNVLKLEPGQAVFLAQNEPHAYLSGDCIECMATSDNVVRAGLTPKFKDVETLLHMLTYKCGRPIIDTGSSQGQWRLYKPPVKEFKVFSTKGTKIELPLLQGPSILLVFEGSGGFLTESGKVTQQSACTDGSSYFIHPNTKATIIGREGTEITAFMATINPEFCP